MKITSEPIGQPNIRAHVYTRHATGVLPRLITLQIALLLITDATAFTKVCAQQPYFPSPPGFSRLRIDGNNVRALQDSISVKFDHVEIGLALRAVAARANLSITMDPNITALKSRKSLRLSGMHIAEVLLQLVAEQPMAVHVSRDGQLIVLPDVKSQYAPAHETAQADTGTVRETHLLHAQRLDTVRSVAVSAPRDAFVNKPNVAALQITTRELRAAPSLVGPDLMRQMQLMPGVEARNDYSAGLNVRGGEADQNLILLDGYPIYNPFHVGGLFGTFIDAMVGRVQLFTSAFPARFGGRLSSVMDVQSADEHRPGIHATADVSMIASSATLSGATASARGSWMVAARRTYADVLTGLIANAEVPYHFSDAQAHVRYLLPGGIRAAATGYAGSDILQSSNIKKDFFKWGNAVTGATVEKSFPNSPGIFGRSLGDSAVAELRLSHSQFSSNVVLIDIAAATVTSDISETRQGGSMTFFDTRGISALGYDVATYTVRYGATNVNNFPILPPQSDIAQRVKSDSAFIDNTSRLSSAFILQSGLRADVTPAAHDLAVLPRVSLKFLSNRNLALTAAWGGYTQSMHSLSPEDVPVRAFDSWVAADSAIPVSRAWHFLAGAEQWITPSLSVRVEAFSKHYRQLTEPNLSGNATVSGDDVSLLTGQSNGVDLFLRAYRSRAFQGWLSYTYALNTRTTSDGARFHPGQDRRHELNAVGSWDHRNYSLSLRFGLASGTPYTPNVGVFSRRVYDPITGVWTEQSGYGNNHDNYDNTQVVGGVRDSGRLPLTHRLDLGMTRGGHVHGVPVETSLSVTNAYNARNTFAYVYDFRRSPPTRSALPQFPILPTIGVRIGY